MNVCVWAQPLLIYRKGKQNNNNKNSSKKKERAQGKTKINLLPVVSPFTCLFFDMRQHEIRTISSVWYTNIMSE